MINVLIDLLQRDIDEVSRQLADLYEERRRYQQDADYWSMQLQGRNSELGFANGDQIAAWLQYGERAHRELKMLEEKDFLVETRIFECRELLLTLNQRKEGLQVVVERRRQQDENVVRRRQLRDLTERSTARRMVQEEESWQ